MARIATAATALISLLVLPTTAHPLTSRQVSSLEWGPCENDFDAKVPVDCATLQVPLDWTKEDTSPPMDLQLLRVKASAEPFMGSILFNPGGPGNMGTEHIATTAASRFRVLQGHYDLIGFDPRGTGKTIPFACNYSALPPAIQKRDGAHLPQRDMFAYLEDEAWDKARMFAEQCYKDNSETGRFMSTAFVARDMLAIVQALDDGDDLLRYWGASYGAILGQTFAGMFPDKVDRMFLESIMDPTDYLTGLWDRNMLDTDASFDNFLKECLAAPKLCRLANLTESVTADDIKRAVGEVLDEVYGSGQIVEKGNSALSWYGGAPASLYETLKRSIFFTLYSVDQFPALDNLLVQTIARNFSLFESSSATPSTPPEAEGDFESVLAGLDNPGIHSFFGISCSDGAVRATAPGQIREYVERQQASSDMADAYLPQFWACPAWQFEPAERYEGPFGGHTKTPLLLANGLADPATPMAYAIKAHQVWEGSALLTHKGHGHGVENQPSKCTDQVIRAYFRNGTLPEEGTVCEPDTPAFEWAYELARKALEAAEEASES